VVNIAHDGVLDMQVRQGDSVFVFPTLRGMYDYIQENGVDKTSVHLVPVVKSGDYQMYYINVVPKSAQYLMSQWVYRYLDTPYMHPTYGEIRAWGFWYYTYMP
jgi:hypothetical protein